jgi:hypothetical protein
VTTTILAILALVVSAAAAVFAYQQGKASTRNANAAEGAEKAAHRSADSAEESAVAARRVARADLERDHLANFPIFNGKFSFEPDTRGHGRWLVYEFNLDRGYDMTAKAIGMNGQPVPNREVVAAKEPGTYRVYVERWPEAEKDPWPYRSLEICFWPPAQLDRRPVRGLANADESPPLR